VKRRERNGEGSVSAQNNRKALKKRNNSPVAGNEKKKGMKEKLWLLENTLQHD